jgi:hypothetical protein
MTNGKLRMTNGKLRFGLTWAKADLYLKLEVKRL